ncbi:hypothetical protein K435DRAFT_862434 [Dendrothele bispora CBS 962.96]|uniref:Uncharacterized protein n=1 Tax=Dendrothele bispora (strain CBS 962.96) TaxID=1314807 RepID=A0A4S8LSI8_DENBC|nr:hypothetical protein K435DRAFT_862434 [Dendrothele bispora CBS 962.96]
MAFFIIVSMDVGHTIPNKKKNSPQYGTPLSSTYILLLFLFPNILVPVLFTLPTLTTYDPHPSIPLQDLPIVDPSQTRNIWIHLVFPRPSLSTFSTTSTTPDCLNTAPPEYTQQPSLMFCSSSLLPISLAPSRPGLGGFTGVQQIRKAEGRWRRNLRKNKSD